MASTNLKLTATADTSDAKRKLDDLKKQSINVQDEIAQKNRERMKEAIGLIAPVAISIQALIRVVDGAINKVQEFIGRMVDYRDTYAKTGEHLDNLAKSLNATTAETIRLQAAADAAGIGAKDYANALEKIKAGTVTLDQQATAWESIASSTAIAQSRSRLFAGYIARADQENEQAIGTAEEIASRLGGLGVHGDVAQTFLDEVLDGRREHITANEYVNRAVSSGILVQSLGVDAETIPIAVKALNALIDDQNRKLKEAQEEALRKNSAFAERVFRMTERFMNANGGDFNTAIATAASVVGIDTETASRWYAQGLNELPAEEVALRQIQENAKKSAEDAKEIEAQLKRWANDPNLRSWERYGIPYEKGTNAGNEGDGTASAAAALKWAFSEGGGLLAGVNYGFGVFQNDPAAKIVSAISDGTKATTRELKGISQKLED